MTAGDLMKYALNIPNFGSYAHPYTLVELAQEAEEAGWDGFFLWDHMIVSTEWCTPFVDPWVALSAVAVKTETIRIGTLITPVARRRPWVLARETVSVDHLSNGRLILGVGLGNPPAEFEAFGEEGKNSVRAKKLDESLDILTGLWSGEKFSYSGEYYTVDEVTFLPKPVQSPRIPIWVACMWPHEKPLERAVQYDGVAPIHACFPEDLTPDDVKALVAWVHGYRRDAYDVVVSGATPDPEKGCDIVAPFIEAGATWWSENINGLRAPFNEMRTRIQKGPPEV